jgi:6-phosphogluconolactonase
MLIARTIGLVFLLTAMHGQNPALQSHEEKYWVYVGTANYNGAASRKLYVGRFDTGTGELELAGVAAETENSGFLAVHPNQRYLYATNEVGNLYGRNVGGVSAFRREPATGKVELLNQVPSFGANPAYVTVSRNGRFALVASYYGGTVSLPIRNDGSLGPPASEVRETGSGVNRERQESSHPHSVVLSPDNRFALIADLGLDKIFVYRFDQDTGSLMANSPAFVQAPPGSGPRHLAFSPGARFAYVVNELNSTISTYSFDAQQGVLHLLQTISTLPPGFRSQNTGAEVQAGPSGRFIYVSNRGHDSIGVFEVNPQKGTLKAIQDVSCQGKTPRNFAFDPSGKFLLIANQDSDEIVVFKADAGTGRLTPTGTKVTVVAPVCIAFMADEEMGEVPNVRTIHRRVSEKNS